MKILGLLMTMFLLAGCSTFSIPPYGISAENVATAKKLKDKKITVQILPPILDEDAKETSINCRAAGPVNFAEENMTFGKYVVESMRSELSLAEVLSEHSPHQLAIHFKDVSYSTSPSSHWTIASEVTYDGKKHDLTMNQDFEGSFIAGRACTQIANNYPVIVRKYNAAVLNLITSSKATKP